jgi:hypothetical protein
MDVKYFPARAHMIVDQVSELHEWNVIEQAYPGVPCTLQLRENSPQKF